MPGNDIGSSLIGLFAARGASSESAIRTEEKVGPITRGLLAVMQAFLLSFTIAVWLLAWVGLGYSLFGHWPLWASAAGVFLSLGFLISMPLLMYNLVRELQGHYWRKSPFEQIIGPALVDVLEHQANPEESVARIVPYRLNGETSAISAVTLDATPVAREDARMCDFLRLAVQHRVAQPTRRNMQADGKGAWMLQQSGERLDEVLYTAIVQDLQDRWGFVRKPQRRGQSTEWVVPPDRALRILEREIERRAQVV